MSLFPPFTVTDNQRTLIDLLLEQGIINFDTREGFETVVHRTDPAAPRAPYEIKINLTTPEAADRIADLIEEMLVAAQIGKETQIIGVPHTGVAFATRIAERNSRPQFFLFQNTAGHFVPDLSGRRPISPSDDSPLFCEEFALIHDVLSDADTILRARQAITSYGGEVKDIFVLLDDQCGDRARFTKAGIRVHAVFTLTTLLGYLREKGGVISTYTRDACLSYPTLLDHYRVTRPS